MPKRSNEFQKVVFLVKKHVSESAKVTESMMLQDLITGSDREVDVCIEDSIAGHDIIVSIECVDHKRKADVTWVEQMKSKHERLPTNALVLVSRTGFSSEAKRVAKVYGFDTLALEDVNEYSIEKLFGNIKTLWNKIVSLSPKKVTVRVSQTGNLPPENVAALPDNSVYVSDGTIISSLKDILTQWLKSDKVLTELVRQGDETHKSFLTEWGKPTDGKGNYLCLQKEEPKTLRTIEWIRVGGECSFKVSKFSLKHGMLGGTRISWGTSEIEGKKALLVASENECGDKKLSIKLS